MTYLVKKEKKMNIKQLLKKIFITLPFLSYVSLGIGYNGYDNLLFSSDYRRNSDNRTNNNRRSNDINFTRENKLRNRRFNHMLNSIKLKKRSYLGKIVAIGTNDLRGYYKVKLLDYEQPIEIWVKDGINNNVHNNHGSYIPLQIGDEVIVEFTHESITSGIIKECHKPKDLSKKLSTIDDQLLNTYKRYVLISTREKSKLVYDENNAYIKIDYRSGIGNITINNSSVNIEHSNNINSRANNNVNITANNQVNILAQQINLNQNQSSSNNKVTSPNQLQEQINLYNYQLSNTSRAINFALVSIQNNTKALEKYLSNQSNELIEKLTNNLSAYEQLTQDNLFTVKFEKDPQTKKETPTIYIKSIDNILQNLNSRASIFKEQISNTLSQAKDNFYNSKNELINELSSKLDNLREQITTLLNKLNELPEEYEQLKNQLTRKYQDLRNQIPELISRIQEL